MIIVCQNCTARFQVDDAKVPAGPFTVRCPKCQEIVSSGSAEVNVDKVAAGPTKPSPAPAKFERSVPAPLFRSAPGAAVQAGADQPAAPSLGVHELAKALASLLRSDNGLRDSKVGSSWKSRCALVCTAPAHREMIARGLNDKGYEVFLAEDTQQAVERMRHSQLDVVILDPEFDATEQGAAFVTRDVNVRRPADRRRLFFVLLSSSKRTMDTHSAFLQNVNLSVNFSELAELPEILDHALLEFNELYKDFNQALNVAPL
jgi:predicted Zn finger-like uncharacterized protein